MVRMMETCSSSPSLLTRVNLYASSKNIPGEKKLLVREKKKNNN